MGGTGRLVAGRYELLERIGEGGVAVVYRARDARLDRIVALKVLREQYANDPEFMSRFEREARLAAALNHPNIVDVYDYGSDDGTYYIAMEYVAGGNLRDRLRSRGPLSAGQAVAIASQVLAALAQAHARGLVHRDVKPQNILLDTSGATKLTDFGIAQATTASQLTQAGMTIGTAAYMAPEQATGGTIGPATDIYAVGVVLYEMLTGRPPFEGGSPVQLAYRHVNEEPPRPSSLARGIPAGLEAVVMNALEKDPTARFRSANEMLAALRDYESFPLYPDAPAGATAPMATVRVPRVAPPPRAVPPVAPVPARNTRDTLLLLLAGILALAIFGLLVFLTLGGGGSSATPTRPATAVSATPTRTLTPAPPSATPVPGAPPPPPSASPTQTRTFTVTLTPPPATGTQTNTPVPTGTPTVTQTPTPALRPVSPTATPAPPTATPVPPSPSPTRPPPTPTRPSVTATPAPPTVAPVLVDGQPGVRVTLDAASFTGGYRTPDGNFRDRSAEIVYGARTDFSTMQAQFDLPAVPRGDVLLTIVGLDDPANEHTPILIELNGREVFSGPAPFENDTTDPNRQPPWTQRQWTLRAEALRQGQNTLQIRNLADSNTFGAPPWFALDQAQLVLRT